jgi:MauM/NapG family ferredoxin protein
MRGKEFVNRQLRLWRFAIPTTVFILCVYAVSEMRYPLGRAADLILWLSRMDPLLLIAHMRSAVAIPDWIWLPVLVMLATAFIGRIFCGWICPLGGLLNLVYYARRLFRNRRLARTTDAKLYSFLKRAKYWWLAFIAVLASAGLGIVSVFTPLTLFSHEITRLYLGQFPWLLAAAILSGFIFFPRFWCTYICPTGILFTLVAGWRRVKVRVTDKCVNCDRCKRVCPVNAVDTGPKGSGDECLVCGRCLTSCSRQAIRWNGRSQPLRVGDMQTRRNFLKLGTAIAVGSLINLPARRLFMASAFASPSLRPPGAIPESDFLATCNRCSRCVKVCPTGGLVPMSLASGIMAYETPELIPRKGCCDLCMLCSRVCPTGAIRPIKTEEVKIGVARLDELSCLAWAQGKACLICKERCPANAIVIDDSKRPYIDVQNCIGCGACENACPLEEAAVKVVPYQ